MYVHIHMYMEREYKKVVVIDLVIFLFSPHLKPNFRNDFIVINPRSFSILISKSSVPILTP